MERARAGDREAFDSLVRRYLGPARNFCAKLLGDPVLAEDCCQEGFVKAWRGLAGFRAEAKFRTWLWRILVNAANDIRKPRMAALEEEMDPEAIPERDIAAEEAVAAALAKLPERQRQVLLMKVELDATPREIADALGISYENAKANLSLARKKMKELLG
ncbi:MAG: sigma-70 family RNA polymerase sigma factor [Planctomycetes bacterium]|nr:sigma-70 family RNA polymerase sigma factor [Planctomycetota bacterium]